MSHIDNVLEELERAKKIWPLWPKDPIHAASVVVEEAGELQRAALQFTYEGGYRGALYEEAKQTAAMALRFMEHMVDYELTRSEQVRSVHKSGCREGGEHE